MGGIDSRLEGILRGCDFIKLFLMSARAALSAREAHALRARQLTTWRSAQIVRAKGLNRRECHVGVQGIIGVKLGASIKGG
jgi:hypothetical protein